ncbi:MAG: dUTP pyrophosphatase [Actinomycetota bacterium]|nr:dUTP pyrophosphatase [Actinomycetota bacterium]
MAPEPLEVVMTRIDPRLPPPSYACPGDAGADLRTAIDVTLGPGERVTVPTGLAVALPMGYAAFVHPRSGLAARHGLTVVNAPGTVDAGYRGEIRVTLLNTDAGNPVVLRRGDRIAQLIVQRVEHVTFVEVAELPPSVRGTGGFGSSGGHHAATDPATNSGTEAGPDAGTNVVIEVDTRVAGVPTPGRGEAQ